MYRGFDSAKNDERLTRGVCVWLRPPFCCLQLERLSSGSVPLTIYSPFESDLACCSRATEAASPLFPSVTTTAAAVVVEALASFGGTGLPSFEVLSSFAFVSLLLFSFASVVSFALAVTVVVADVVVVAVVAVPSLKSLSAPRAPGAGAETLRDALLPFWIELVAIAIVGAVVVFATPAFWLLLPVLLVASVDAAPLLTPPPLVATCLVVAVEDAAAFLAPPLLAATCLVVAVAVAVEEYGNRFCACCCLEICIRRSRSTEPTST